MRICKVFKCGEKHIAKGYCWRHYMAFRRHGRPIYINITKKPFFSENQLSEIRKRRKNGEKLESIAASFNCSHTTIRHWTRDIPSPPLHYGRGNRKADVTSKISKSKGRPKKILNREMEMGL